MRKEPIIVLDSEEEALKACEFLKSHGYEEAYVEELTQYDQRPLKFEWGVFIDDVYRAFDAMELFMERNRGGVSDADSSADDDIPDESISDSEQTSEPQLPSSRKPYVYTNDPPGCFDSKVWPIIVVLVSLGILFRYSLMTPKKTYQAPPRVGSFMKKFDSIHNMQERLKNREVRLYKDKEGNYKTFVTQDLTVERLKQVVKHNDELNPKDFGDGFVVNKTEMKGKTIYYELQSSKLKKKTKHDNSLKKTLAKNLINNLGFEKFVFGKKLFEKMDTMGISFKFQIIDDPDSKPQRIIISAAYLKSIDDQENARVEE